MREIVDRDGRSWRVDVISHGRTSGYLNPKVHRPVLQFVCLTRVQPRRYTPLPIDRADSLDDLDDGDLAQLLDDAKVH